MTRSGVRGSLCLALILGAGAAPRAQSAVRFERGEIEVRGDLIEVAFVDLEPDGVHEILVVERTSEDRRELHIHRIEGGAYESQPAQSLDVLDEALAFAVADVRDEPGRELVFLTASGTWSYSLALDGYRGNVRRLTEEPLVYDLPTPSRLPRWPYVIPHDGRDRLLLPGPEGFAVWGVRKSAASTEGTQSPAMVPLARFARRAAPRRERRNGDMEVTLGRGGMRFTPREDGSDPWIDEGASSSSVRWRRDEYFTSESAYRAPAVVDLNGDGHRDVLVSDGKTVEFHRGTARRIAERPGRTEPVPDYLDRHEVRLWFRDLDGDGDLDLIAQCSDEASGLEATDVSLVVLLNDGQHLFPPRPSQVLRFRSHDLDLHVADVDFDGRLDLSLTEFVMPSLLQTVAGVEIEMTELVFRGVDGERPFEREPILHQVDTFDEESLVQGLRERRIAMDFDGDGLADWVELDVEGRLSIHRTIVESHFFSADTWSIESRPWRRFESFGELDSLEIEDLNGDGFGDVVSRTERGLGYLLSQPARGSAR